MSARTRRRLPSKTCAKKLYARAAPPFGADPTIERLRDVVGTLRCVYAAAPSGPARAAVAAAAAEIKSAIGVAQSRQREKELGGRIRSAQRALLAAAQAAPWAAPALLVPMVRW